MNFEFLHVQKYIYFFLVLSACLDWKQYSSVQITPPAPHFDDIALLSSSTHCGWWEICQSDSCSFVSFFSFLKDFYDFLKIPGVLKFSRMCLFLSISLLLLLPFKTLKLQIYLKPSVYYSCSDSLSSIPTGNHCPGFWSLLFPRTLLY